MKRAFSNRLCRNCKEGRDQHTVASDGQLLCPITDVVFQPGRRRSSGGVVYRMTDDQSALLARKLRWARLQAKLTLDDAALLSGVGVKTISSLETGMRTSSIKLAHLLSLVAAYQCDGLAMLRDLMPQEREIA